MRFYIFMILALLASPAMATDQDPWQLVGQAQLKVLFWPVYDSSLFSTDGRYREGQRPLRLQIHYLREVEAADLVENTRSEWEGLTAVPARSEEWLLQLAQMWPDVQVDDVLAVEVDALGSSQFFLNGEVLGSIEDVEFGQYFLAIWLSPETSRPALRLALIGES